MTLRLPPLNAVRAFVAAARHQSFTRAAAELHVTHGAVSRQVKSLEAHLGVALFERRIRQVVLTAEGQAFYAQADAGLAQIGAAARALTARAPVRAVRINVRPSFAVRWLIPRLPDFVAQHPGIAPEVITSTAAPARASDGFDVAIRRGLQGWPPALQVRPWLEDEALVVGAPALVEGAGRHVASPRDLAAHVLLGARSRKGDWDDWLRQAGVARLRPAGRLALDHLHLVLQAAVDGLGVAMAPRSLLARDLAQRRLVPLLPLHRLALERYYYGVAPGAPPEAQLFVQWLEDVRSAEPPA
ncbi:LysR substrate-binding domain-containing protein [Pseudorhodoferax sp.]|uniref:LysR substrate-binding domain-containing protein n=1 Tax=Pseudorhodoferax sp. TaxID=1993553 RepID=UPI0039E3220D